MEPTTRRPLVTSALFNSTVAFVLAGMLVTTIHEGSHLAASLLLGHPARLFPNLVDPGSHISDRDVILIAGAGPLFSLVTGLLVIWLVKTDTWANGFAKLVVLWFGFLSAETGFGYFFVAPIVPNGDTGEVLSLLHAAWYIYAIVFVIGVAGFGLLLPRLFSRRFSRFVDTKRPFFQLGMWSWLYGTVVLLIIYFFAALTVSSVVSGSPVIFILVGVATIGIFTPIANFAGGNETVAASESLPLGRPIVGIVVAAVIAVFIVLVLAHGIHFA